jgi:hypothetical protein
MVIKNRRTFLQNAAAASLFALPSAQAQGPTPSGRPPIQFDFAASLDKEEVYKFLDSNVMTTWDAPVDVKKGYSLSTVPKKLQDLMDKYPNDMPGPLQGTPIRLFWAVQKRCKVFEGDGTGQLVGTSNIVIPKSWQVTIQFYAVLLIRNDAPAQAVRGKIETAFKNFRFPRDGDPLSFIQKAIANDATIQTDYFSIVTTFSISKVPGTLDVRPEVEDAASAFYAGKTAGEIWTGPNTKERIGGDNGFLAQRKIRRVCPEKEEFVGRVPSPKQDPHKVELSAGQNPEDAIKSIANDDTPTVCGELKENDWPLLTLATWPEFKVDWRDFAFDIGCGIRIVLTLPVLQIQWSAVDLWIYTKYPPSWSNVLNQIVTCAFNAALSGAVVGVVLLDVVAGLTAFVAAFENCIQEHLGQTIECMIPGIGLVTRVASKWQDVKI